MARRAHPGDRLPMPRWWAVIGMVGWLLSVSSLGMADPPETVAPSANPCLTCHQERDPALVAAWQSSRHATAGVDCSACHGTEHTGQMAAQARRNEACTGCHAREKDSYFLSKHGVIATLEGARWDFSQPLHSGHLRAPTCGYCHLHANNHDTGAGLFPLAPLGAPPPPDAATRSEARSAPCRDCHSPRLVETWFASGDRMVEIGRMKIREAAQVIDQMDPPPAEQTLRAQALYRQMATEHLSNIHLGVGHQSPDHQWWHGHPALDGDLLRIKSLRSDQLRAFHKTGY